jgi:HEAT repeat protein
MKKINDEEYMSLRSNLLSRTLTAADANQQANFITALGNTQDPTLANELLVFLDDTDPTVRRATAMSLGTLGVEQVADMLVSRYQQEDNRQVRSAIADSLKSWSDPTPKAMALFRETVRAETDESSRYKVVLLLGKNFEKFPENEAVLREMMRSESSKRIRQKIAEILSGP